MLLKGEGGSQQGGYHGDAGGPAGVATSGPWRGRGEEGAIARRHASRGLAPDPQITLVITCPLLGWDTWGQKQGGTRLRSKLEN